METQIVIKELKESQEHTGKLQIEIKNLNHVIREADTQRERDLKEIEQVISLGSEVP